jgi:hypothetical protein
LDPQQLVFQLERGEKTNKLHYQGFLKLKNKKRLLQVTNTLIFAFFGIEVIPAADEDAFKAYCTKSLTRVRGPFGFSSTVLRNRA